MRAPGRGPGIDGQLHFKNMWHAGMETSMFVRDVARHAAMTNDAIIGIKYRLKKVRHDNCSSHGRIIDVDTSAMFG